MKKLLLTYVNLLILLIQSSMAVTAPYRLAGLVTQLATPNPAMIFGLGAGALFASQNANATLVEAPNTICPAGYTRQSSQCVKEEQTPITESCSVGSPTNLYEPTTGTYVDTCLQVERKKKIPVCPTGTAGNVKLWGQEGNANYQNCYETKSVPLGGNCGTGWSRSTTGSECFRWVAPQSVVCPVVCDPSQRLGGGVACPVDKDPLQDIDPIQATCTQAGVNAGTCSPEGSQVTVNMPNLQYAEVPGDTNYCQRSIYDPVDRQCPTPNIKNPNPRSEPIWSTPFGKYAEDASNYDSQTGVPERCFRIWTDELVYECANGTTYDPAVGGCVDEQSKNCGPNATLVNGQCVHNDGTITCPPTHNWDDQSKTCVIKANPGADAWKNAYTAGADMGWALGSLQSGTTQGADSTGNMNLDMKLLDREADSRLQANTGLGAITKNTTDDANSYAAFDQNYWNEDAQAQTIRDNKASYDTYLTSTDPNQPLNTPAEAYGVMDDTINVNRPPPIDPDSDMFESNSEYIGGLGTTNPWFGDCSTGSTTKRVLNPDLQVTQQKSCVKPVETSFDSCVMQRFIEQPTIKILEGLENSRLEVLDSRTIRLTLGKICDNCKSGGSCTVEIENIKVLLKDDVEVESATLVNAVWDDMISISVGETEILRHAGAPWETEGWPNINGTDSCERSTSWTLDNTYGRNIDVTEAFKNAVDESSIINFIYKAGFGGLGEAYAQVDIVFTDDIRDDWGKDDRQYPDGCLDKYTPDSQGNSQCTFTGWECDVSLPDATLGMEDWEEWDAVRNWNITNGGYDANSIVNSAQTSAYGSTHDVGELWFKGTVRVDEDDDDTWGFVFGYPDNPIWNKDPGSPDYDPNAEDSDNNHFFILVWTSNFTSGGGSNPYGMRLQKWYTDYKGYDLTWGGNARGLTVGGVTIIEEIGFVRTPWQRSVTYNIEFKQSELEGLRYTINDVDWFNITPSDYEFKTGRFGFITHSIANVKFQGIHKVTDFDDFGPLFPGDSAGRCLKGHVTGAQCNQEQADTIANVQDTCKVLEEDTECTWVGREECPTQYVGSDGNCLVETNIYNCVDNSNAWEEVEVDYGDTACGLVPPCQDGDPSCNLRGKENNKDFGQAVSEVAVVSEMRNYMDCTDPSNPNTCQVFKGDKEACSYDQFGLIDCCEEFQGKTLDLFKFAMNAYSVASFADEQLNISESASAAMFGTDTTDGWIPKDLYGEDSFIGGSWKKVSDGYDSATGAVSDAWSSAVDSTSSWWSPPEENAAGNTEAVPTDENGNPSTTSMFTDWFKDMAVDKIKEELKEYAMEKIMDLLGQELVDAIGGALADMGLAAAGEAGAAQIGQALGTVVAFIGFVAAAYAAVQIALMLYKYFNACPESEEQTPMLIKEKKCFYSYNKPCDKFLGICKNKHTDYYCCYPSTLSRIIIEQAIRQSEVFGRSWSPSDWGRQADECRGLTIEEVSKVDFSLIDLSEWLTMMTQANTLPDGTETLTEMTKDNHYSNPFGREDLVERQRERGIEDLNEKARKPADQQDIYNQLDCSDAPGVKGCKYGIFQD